MSIVISDNTLAGVGKLYNEYIEKLKAKCSAMNEENHCTKFPDLCKTCILVTTKVVKLNKVWSLVDTGIKSNEADIRQHHQLLMRHIRGDCLVNCLYCEVEKISPPLPIGGTWHGGYGRKTKGFRGKNTE